MDALKIKIVETVAIDYPASDGQMWSTERGAQNYNAELEMLRILGPELLESPQTHVYTQIRDLASAPTPDILALRGVLDTYLTHALPAFLALKGEFAYGTGRQIELPNGRKFVDRQDAALHVLGGAMEELFNAGALSEVTKKRMCGLSENTQTESEQYQKHVKAYKFRWKIEAFFKMTDDKGKRIPGYEKRLRDALQAIIIERSKRIEGVQRPAK